MTQRSSEKGYLSSSHSSLVIDLPLSWQTRKKVILLNFTSFQYSLSFMLEYMPVLSILASPNPILRTTNNKKLYTRNVITDFQNSSSLGSQNLTEKPKPYMSLTNPTSMTFSIGTRRLATFVRVFSLINMKHLSTSFLKRFVSARILRLSLPMI